MKRLILLLAASALAASPAAAQHAGHVMPPAPAKKAPAKKPAAKKPAAKKAPARKAPAKKAAPKPAPARKAAAKKPLPRKAAPAKAVETKPATDPHAGHAMPTTPPATPPTTPPPADPHAGHAMPPAPAPAADPRAGHAMPSAAADVPVGPPPPEALQGPENAADLAWGKAAMEPGRAILFREHGDIPVYKLLVDQAEVRVRSGRDGYFVNAEGWYGGDIDKLWLKSEIEGDFGSKPDQAEFQALWSHAIDPWFDVQTGIRLDAEPDGRGHVVLGLQGLAPYWIEVDAAAFLSDKGDVTARLEAEHDVRITQKLVLQPRVELDFALQDVPREALGAGLSTGELGLRLRYEIVPQFAPYVGLEYDRAFGDTRRFRRREGDDLGGLSFVAGLRAWF